MACGIVMDGVGLGTERLMGESPERRKEQARRGRKFQFRQGKNETSNLDRAGSCREEVEGMLYYTVRGSKVLGELDGIQQARDPFNRTPIPGVTSYTILSVC